jgi:hypothetical protein
MLPDSTPVFEHLLVVAGPAPGGGEPALLCHAPARPDDPFAMPHLVCRYLNILSESILENAICV